MGENLVVLLSKWERHLLVLRGLSAASVKAYRDKIVEFFKWHGDEVVEAVSRDDIERYLEDIFYRGNANITRMNKLGAISGFWRFLRYERVVTEDITDGIPKPRLWRKFIQDLTKEERLRMFSALRHQVDTEKGLRDICILILLTFGGLRIGEVANLRADDLVDEGDHILVQLPDDIVKQHGSRVVEFWKSPSAFLRQWLHVRLVLHNAGKRAPLFVAYQRGDHPRDHALVERNIDRMIKGIARRAGIRRVVVHAHMFRASHGSDLRNIQGYDIAAIAGRLGHRNISTTDRYLPNRRRVSRQYRSLREYWIEWERLWIGGESGDTDV